MAEHSGTESHRNSIRSSGLLVLWTVAWVATLALARYGPGRLWEQSAASWAAVAANAVVGIGWIVAFTQFLRNLDDLERKIMQDALAITLGVGWVGGFAYVVANTADLVSFNVAVLPGSLGVVYLIAFFVGKIRYR